MLWRVVVRRKDGRVERHYTGRKVHARNYAAAATNSRWIVLSMTRGTWKPRPPKEDRP